LARTRFSVSFVRATSLIKKSKVVGQHDRYNGKGQAEHKNISLEQIVPIFQPLLQQILFFSLHIVHQGIELSFAFVDLLLSHMLRRRYVGASACRVLALQKNALI